MTAPISGIYQVSAGVSWSFGNGAGVREMALGVNGGCCRATSQVPASGQSVRQVASDLLQLSAGEFVEVFVDQTSGGSLDAQSSNQTFLAMHWVGPG
jgi:hypothetical protein